MRNIKQALEEHLAAACAEFNKEQIFGVFLYGSQNYGLDTEDSDVDTKAIYIPTLEELAFAKPVSKEIRLENGEHCEVKDIREIVNNFKKQNINFVELLFTPHFLINNIDYVSIWSEYFIKNREDIARYNVNAGVKSMAHQALHTLKQNPHDGKKIANVFRLVRFIEKYLRGENYKSCMTLMGEVKEFALDLKVGVFYDPYNIGEVLKYSLLHYADNDFSHFNKGPEHQEKVDKLMREGIMKMIKKNL